MERKDCRVLTEGCRYFGIELNSRQIEQFLKYYDLLTEWNSFMNLTGITEFGEVMQKHFVDSLALAGEVPVQDIKSLIDIGTGAGFPGIPIKIAFPHIEVVLLDSLAKRVKFLNEVIAQLELTGIRAVHGRAEDLAKQEQYREHFDLSISRAVANLASLSEYCIPYTKIKGCFISYKSGEVEQELQEAETAIQLLGGEKKRVVKFQLPGSDIDRSLIIIEKKKATPKKYPRKSGLPKKEPLR